MTLGQRVVHKILFTHLEPEIVALVQRFSDQFLHAYFLHFIHLSDVVEVQLLINLSYHIRYALPQIKSSLLWSKVKQQYQLCAETRRE